MKTIYYNAEVYTGQLPLQQAFLIENNQFSAVGTNDQILSLPSDKTVDLHGAFVCPGFNDSHMHLVNYGQTLTIAPLAEHTHTLSDMLLCLAKTGPGRGGWILGRGWNQDYFSDVHRMPNRYDLDKVSTEIPVCAIRACGHALVVNSKALNMLNITANTLRIDGGEIGITDGQPNGQFFDNAMELILKLIPAPGKEDIKSMIKSACRALNSYGITSCHSDDYSTFQNLPWETVNEAYHELEASGELTVRVYQQANFTNLNELQRFINNGNKTRFGTTKFRIGPLKLLGDGALGARTAFLSKPYADDPTTNGLSVFSASEFDQLIGYAHRCGMQVAIHCIGDACLDLVLNSIEKAQVSQHRINHRHGIVHCQITRPEQLERIAANNLHIYAQSIFLDYDINIVASRVGTDLAGSSYNWKTLKDKGCTISNGSDCPVERPNVMAGIQCAVTRSSLDTKIPPYLPSEAFTVQEAIDTFTKAGAYASFEEDIKGQIRPGMLADFTILGSNPFNVNQTQLKDIPILGTYLNGKCVYNL